MKFDPEIHRRRSIRLRDFDYTRKGAYFVTVCVQHRECLFGNVEDSRMAFNDAGEMVRSIWEELPERFPNLVLDQSMVMPNHFHGILFLTDSFPVGASLVGALNRADRTCRAATNRAGTRPAPTLGEIVGAFKALSTVEYVRAVNHQNWPPFPGRLWQRNYFERVIRNDDELHQAREYIAANPAKWAWDAENPNHTSP